MCRMLIMLVISLIVKALLLDVHIQINMIAIIKNINTLFNYDCIVYAKFKLKVGKITNVPFCLVFIVRINNR